MDQDLENIFKLDEGERHVVESENSRRVAPRLRSGLPLGNLLREGSATFEIDADEETFDDFEDEHEFYLKEFMTDPKQQNEAILKSIGLDEATGSFDDIMGLMKDVDESGRVKKMVIKKGTGKLIPPDGKVWIAYVAFAEGKDEAFDSTIQRGVIETLFLNKDLIIRGLRLALVSMEYKEIAKFWIHHEYAYGALGSPPRIPPASSVTFTVEMVDAVGPEKLNSLFFMAREDLAALPFEKLYEGGMFMKTQGNEQFEKGNFHDAIKRYRKGIDILEDYRTVNQEEDNKRTDLCFTFYLNLAQAYLKFGKAAEACTACIKALKIPQPDAKKVKVFYRFALAKFLLKKYEDARDLLKKAIKAAPVKTFEMADLENNINKAIKREETSVLPMYRRMIPSSTKKSEDSNGHGNSPNSPDDDDSNSKSRVP